MTFPNHLIIFNVLQIYQVAVNLKFGIEYQHIGYHGGHTYEHRNPTHPEAVVVPRKLNRLLLVDGKNRPGNHHQIGRAHV